MPRIIEPKDLQTVEQRLAAAEASLRIYADTTGKEAPTRLLGDNNAPSEELLLFCLANGACLNWIFLGDVRGMIRDSYNRATYGNPTVKDAAEMAP